MCQSFLVLKMIYSFAFLKKKKRGVDPLQETGSPEKQLNDADFDWPKGFTQF